MVCMGVHPERERKWYKGLSNSNMWSTIYNTTKSNVKKLAKMDPADLLFFYTNINTNIHQLTHFNENIITNNGN